MNRRNITIAVIAVLGLGIGLVVYGILSTPHKSAAPPRNVVIAAMNIPANTKIVPAMVTTEQKPTDQVEATALADPADAVGMLATADIPQGAVLTPLRLSRPAPQPQGLQVANGMRAVTIAVDQVKGLAGLLIPGDHVDVLAVPRNNGRVVPAAFAIVRDARVVAVGRDLGVPQPAPTGSANPNARATPAPYPNVTLAVSPQQADTIMAADLEGTIRLALRSAHEPARSLSAETIVYSVPKPAGAAGPPKPQGVIVVNGSSVTRVVP